MAYKMSQELPSTSLNITLICFEVGETANQPKLEGLSYFNTRLLLLLVLVCMRIVFVDMSPVSYQM